MASGEFRGRQEIGKVAIPFVGKRFNPAEFKAYLAQVKFGTFVPKFVTLHHTGNPTLAMRPNGFSDQHLRNLLHYYEVTQKWSGAPHLFVDDREDGIIVFQRLDRKGVHAKSFNRNSWGIEMLGNFDVEPFDGGRGAKVRDISMRALALMCERLKVGADTIKFHRDDPLTTKKCPGIKVSKADVQTRVSALLKQPLPADLIPGSEWGEWKVVLPSGQEYEPVHETSGRRSRVSADSSTH